MSCVNIQQTTEAAATKRQRRQSHTERHRQQQQQIRWSSNIITSVNTLLHNLYGCVINKRLYAIVCGAQIVFGTNTHIRREGERENRSQRAREGIDKAAPIATTITTKYHHWFVWTKHFYSFRLGCQEMEEKEKYYKYKFKLK